MSSLRSWFQSCHNRGIILLAPYHPVWSERRRELAPEIHKTNWAQLEVSALDRITTQRHSRAALPPVNDINIHISKSLGTRHESPSIREFESRRNRDPDLPVSAKLVQSDPSVYNPYSTRGEIRPRTALWIQVSGHRPHTASKVMTSAVPMPGCLSLR